MYLRTAHYLRLFITANIHIFEHLHGTNLNLFSALTAVSYAVIRYGHNSREPKPTRLVNARQNRLTATFATLTPRLWHETIDPGNWCP